MAKTDFTNKVTSDEDLIEASSIQPNYIISINTDSALQLVITRTFLNLINSIANVFTVKTDSKKLTKKSDSTSDDLKGKIASIDTDLLRNESEEEESLCSFLIKNELGVDIYLNAVNGFKVF